MAAALIRPIHLTHCRTLADILSTADYETILATFSRLAANIAGDLTTLVGGTV